MKHEVKEFTRQWKSHWGAVRSVVFETKDSINVSEITEGNQEECTSFRLDIERGVGGTTVYIIGDSNEGGFLVCEDATELFDIEDLLWQAVGFAMSNSVFDAQDEYDKWVIEQESDDE